MFSIRETMADANVLQDFFPTIELAGDLMPDLRRERGEFNFTNFQSVAAVAAQFPRIFYGALPPQSIAVIRHLVLSTSVNTNLTVDFAITAPGGGFTSQVKRTDGREGGGTPPSGFTQVGTESTAAAGVGALLKLPGTQTPTLYTNIDFIAADLSVDGKVRNLLFSTDGANVQLNLAVIGYERSLEVSEVRS